MWVILPGAFMLDGNTSKQLMYLDLTIFKPTNVYGQNHYVTMQQQAQLDCKKPRIIPILALEITSR